MARVKRGMMTHKRHKKILNMAEGYFLKKRNVFTEAIQQVMKSGQYAYNDRRKRTGQFRRLWITRISAACRAEGITYSRFIEGLTKAGVQVDRKMLSNMAIEQPQDFNKIVEIAKQHCTLVTAG